ncbi:hypothetical protein BV25DRAFT_1830702 [Artomyces pyxidatus]|uniref:Uncharacterized protein n=1 Tax=Artomyces pyxidatus TaxID=48021 RepID=A0ACB8SPP3_9AGAM|nr:hypothetical protein BV25DRAFT_1830702 [Artomyces pyxidatus]
MNPYLRYRPAFSRSLPTQILVTGITLTLVSVLLIQLIFTAQYHWRLAQANFILQLSAVITLLASVIATLKLVLGDTMQDSQDWPFMLNYIAVDLPPLLPSTKETGSWSKGALAAWLVMNATSSALIQITHIQFLTLMYPSRLEARLIFVLLGPLAIVAAIMQLIPIQSNDNVESIADAVRNICAAALSVLFTLALLIWGTLVNRKQAWRTDGGTAAFGVGALLLAFVSTALTFAYIPTKDQYDWVPPLTGAIMLWQSFLGWWWWVGAGMGVGEVEELLRREEKRTRKRQMRDKRRREQKEKARVLWQGMTGKFAGRPKSFDNSPSIPRIDSLDGDAEQSSTTPPAPLSLWSRATATSFEMLRNGYHYLRQSHIIAVRRRAEERVVRMNEVYANEGAHDVPDQPPSVHGWGLGSFGVREREAVDGQVELEAVEGLVRRNVGPSEETGEGDKEGSDTSSQRDGAQRSVWWWGPLQRWRLQDSTVY